MTGVGRGKPPERSNRRPAGRTGRFPNSARPNGPGSAPVGRIREQFRQRVLRELRDRVRAMG